MLLFLVSRFICTALMHVIRPSIMLTGLASLATALTLVVMFSMNLAGVLCLVAISACMSLMFPTIYGIALHGLGDDTKFGGAGLVMAILGGALFPMAQAKIVDLVAVNGEAMSYSVPALCFVVVAAYGFFDLRAQRKHHWS
jgi:FHS family L-fucose permease-like MFS transporter